MIKVGVTYLFRGMVFVVVSKVVHHDDSGPGTNPGFEVLILEGVHKSALWKPEMNPGTTFTCAESSAIANDAVRFPAEE